jgi:hypothetical protein
MGEFSIAERNLSSLWRKASSDAEAAALPRSSVSSGRAEAVLPKAEAGSARKYGIIV